MIRSFRGFSVYPKYWMHRESNLWSDSQNNLVNEKCSKMNVFDWDSQLIKSKSTSSTMDKLASLMTKHFSQNDDKFGYVSVVLSKLDADWPNLDMDESC